MRRFVFCLITMGMTAQAFAQAPSSQVPAVTAPQPQAPQASPQPSPQAAPQPSPQAAPDAPKDIGGVWELSNSDRDRVCNLTFKSSLRAMAPASNSMPLAVTPSRH